MQQNNNIHNIRDQILSLYPQLLEKKDIIQVIAQESSHALCVIEAVLNNTRETIAYIPQNAFSTLNPYRSIIDHLYDIQQCPLEDIYILCDQLLFPKEKLRIPAKQLSTGQAQMGAILLAFHQKAKCIMAHNPFSNLDHLREKKLIQALQTTQRSIIIFNTATIPSLLSTLFYINQAVSRTFPPPKKKPSTTVLVELKKVTTPRLQIDPISLTLCQEITGLVGKNGSGKTTITEIIMHSLPFNGAILFNGKHYTQKELYQIQYLQMLFQDARQSINPYYPLKQILQEPLDETIFYNTLSQLPHLPSWQEQYSHDACLMTIRSLCFARIVARKPQFILLDEPLSDMPSNWQKQFLMLCSSLNIGMLIIEHDLALMKQFCAKCYQIDKAGIHVL